MRIVIAGCEPVTLRALSLLIRSRLAYEVVGETDSAEVLQKLVEANHPDLVIIDEGLPSTQLTDLIPLLKKSGVNPIVVVLDERPETEKTALAAGADEFLFKGDHPERLLISLESIRSSLIEKYP